MHEVSLAMAGNMADKLYIGGSLNVPILKYNREVYYKESDATLDPNNGFNYFEYRERFSSSGVGLNAKLGFIYKPKEYIRLGFAFHTPSIMSVKDELRVSIKTDTEHSGGPLTATTESMNSSKPTTRSYGQVTPYRAIISGSYVFREIENTHKQRAFITADIEYVNYRGSRFYNTDNEEYETDAKKAYYKQANQANKDYLKGALNFRLGGELKFDPWMFRLGAAYYSSPYKDSELKANRILTSGGIGYRNHGIFVDLTYAYTFNKDVNFPYRLNDKPNTFATVNNNRGNLILTVGIKI
jgi:long-subunit fatty acid transport protein